MSDTERVRHRTCWTQNMLDTEHVGHRTCQTQKCDTWRRFSETCFGVNQCSACRDMATAMSGWLDRHKYTHKKTDGWTGADYFSSPPFNFLPNWKGTKIDVRPNVLWRKVDTYKYTRKFQKCHISPVLLIVSPTSTDMLFKRANILNIC